IEKGEGDLVRRKIKEKNEDKEEGDRQAGDGVSGGVAVSATVFAECSLQFSNDERGDVQRVDYCGEWKPGKFESDGGLGRSGYIVTPFWFRLIFEAGGGEDGVVVEGDDVGDGVRRRPMLEGAQLAPPSWE